MGRPRSLCQGWGINDADYNVNPRVLGRQVTCPYHSRWSDMIRRAYSSEMKRKRPTMITSTICEEWKSFMTFRSWMMLQNWNGMHLDKDILLIGNRHYSPETSRFVPHEVNTILSTCQATRGDLPLGVCVQT